MYLVECHFKDDAERRRVEYIAKKYHDAVKKCSGMALVVENEGILDQFLIELRSKLIDEDVRVFRIEGVEVETPTQRRSIEMEFAQRAHSVNAFIGYFVNKRQGELRQQLPGYHRWYQILTRKGKVDLEVEVKSQDGTTLVASVEGFEPAVTLIANELESDLRHFRDGDDETQRRALSRSQGRTGDLREGQPPARGGTIGHTGEGPGQPHARILEASDLDEGRENLRKGV